MAMEMLFGQWIGAAVRACVCVAVLGGGGLVGCSAAEDGLQEAADETLAPAEERLVKELGLEGTWTGQWTTEDGKYGKTHVRVVQDGLSVRGVVDFERHPCVKTMVMSAKIDGARIVGELEEGGIVVRYELSVNGAEEKLEGSFEGIQTGLCLMEKGELRLTR